jgi:hypothetical protein
MDEDATDAEFDEALDVINNWRSSHSFPLNTFQTGLRKKARGLDSTALVAQRLKRLSSIELKLELIPNMKLSRMQDIGGCRAVVRDVPSVRRLAKLYASSPMKHRPVRTDDYIERPKESGYRGVHLVYTYFSDRKTTYNGLRIEVQLRSRLQHAWATAVETVGTFLRQALKSSQGEEAWLSFFALMGSALAWRERTPLVHGTPRSPKVLRAALKSAANALQVESKLTSYGHALQTIEHVGKEEVVFLLQLNPSANTTQVTGYKRGEVELAARDYLAAERALEGRPGAEAVLVSVDSVTALRSAYPNYFLDTKAFVEAYKLAIATLAN